MTHDAFLDAITTLFNEHSPHLQALGFRLVELSAAGAKAHVPYRQELVGDPETGVLHGGVVTSLLDTVGGAACLAFTRRAEPIATLDLRIDYLRPSRPGRELWALVECYKATPDVAFARGVAYDEHSADPVAAMAATYMLGTKASGAEGGAGSGRPTKKGDGAR